MNENNAEALLRWWNSLQNNNGGRARLRRCLSPDEVVLLPETFVIEKIFPWLPIEAVATITGVASHIKQCQSTKKLGEALAAEQNGRIALSETRFRQLLSARDWTEVYRALRRAVTILDGNIGVVQLAETVILWNEEFLGKYTRPGKGLKYELSRDYYTIAMKYEK